MVGRQVQIYKPGVSTIPCSSVSTAGITGLPSPYSTSISLHTVSRRRQRKWSNLGLDNVCCSCSNPSYSSLGNVRRHCRNLSIAGMDNLRHSGGPVSRIIQERNFMIFDVVLPSVHVILPSPQLTYFRPTSGTYPQPYTPPMYISAYPTTSFLSYIRINFASKFA
jgi:hypothetical protein